MAEGDLRGRQSRVGSAAHGRGNTAHPCYRSADSAGRAQEAEEGRECEAQVQDESDRPTSLRRRDDEPCQPHQVSGHLRRTHGEVRAEKGRQRVSCQTPLHARVLPQSHHAGRGHTGKHRQPAGKGGGGTAHH